MPVSRSKDEAEMGKAKPGGIRGSFCILTPEISSENRDWKLWRDGSLAHTWMEWTIVVLTDVSAAAKGQTNRARSEVAGVVSGAGQVSQCFKHL